MARIKVVSISILDILFENGLIMYWPCCEATIIYIVLVSLFYINTCMVLSCITGVFLHSLFACVWPEVKSLRSTLVFTLISLNSINIILSSMYRRFTVITFFLVKWHFWKFHGMSELLKQLQFYEEKTKITLKKCHLIIYLEIVPIRKHRHLKYIRKRLRIELSMRWLKS